MLPDDLPCKQVNLVDSRRVDEFIERHLGRPWSLQQNGEFGQDTLHAFEVWPDPEATVLVQQWLDSPVPQCPGRLGQEGFGESVRVGTATILNELCNRGLLPEGDLWVHVWW